MRITQLIVVEGKHDEAALKRLIDADIVITHGLHSDEALLDVLREAVKTRGVIVFTDPDHPGQRIRERIAQAVEGVSHAYLNAQDARDKGKVGIEHAAPEDILAALANVVTLGDSESDLTRQDLYALGLSGHPDSHLRRSKLAKHLHLPDVNSKQLLVQLRARNVTKDKLLALMTEKII